jgi:hypothetical protein
MVNGLDDDGQENKVSPPEIGSTSR